MIYVNINETIREKLRENSICSIKMGSHAHGLANENSDVDTLYLYIDHDGDGQLTTDTNGWQYKADGIDENYQELRVFIRGILAGEECAGFEALFGELTVINTSFASVLHELITILKDHRSYALSKAFIGYIKKDYKWISHVINSNADYHNQKFYTKCSHVYRGLSTIKSFIDGTEYKFGYDKSNQIIDITRELKNGTHVMYSSHSKVDENVSNFRDLITSYKKTIHRQLNNNELIRRVDVNTYNKLRVCILRTLILSRSWDRVDIEYGDLPYRIFNEGVSPYYN